MKLYILRHGQTDYNKAGRLQGQLDIELNDYGRELARETSKGLEAINFDLCICSPLNRAIETAELVLGSKPVKIIIDDRIQEISFGKYEGAQSDPKFRDIDDSKFYNFFDKTSDYPAPEGGGEDFEMLSKRVKNFLDELPKKYPNKTILVSTHGAVSRCMMNYFRHVPIKNFWNGGVHRNCSVSEVEYKDNKYNILVEGKVYYDAPEDNFYKINEK